MRSKVFEEVYADAAMDRECPNCLAPPNQWCRRPDGQVRSVPCIRRMRIAAQMADVS